MLHHLLQGLRRPLTEAPPPVDPEMAALASTLDKTRGSGLGHSLSIRQVDAGIVQWLRAGNPCAEQRVPRPGAYGLRFVASPRHADVLLVTGPVTQEHAEALERTWRATPDPKWVVAVGDCGADGGMFAGSYAVVGGVSTVVPVDLVIRGCPPTPKQLLQGLLSLLR